MKTLTLWVLSLALSFISYGQASKKTIETADFHSIFNNSDYAVYVKQSNKNEVLVEALPDILSLTDIYVTNGVLMINVERKPDDKSKSVWAKIDDIKLRPVMKVTVSMKNIQEFQVNGGGKIIAENSLASSNLKLSLSGSGSMDLDLKGDRVETLVSGSGEIALKGYASLNTIVMSGSGSVKSFNCELQKAQVKMSGSGNCEINVSDDLNVDIYGSGVLKHKGNTKNLTRKVYGSGQVERAY